MTVDVVKVLERAGFEIADVCEDPDQIQVTVKKTRPRKGQQIEGQMSLC